MHLRARAGPYRLLIPASSVLEVWEGPAPMTASLPWRDRALPYVDGCALLGLSSGASSRMLIAYGERADDPLAVIVGFDEIAGAVPVERSALRSFPSALTQAHQLFDGVADLPGETAGRLRLRGGLDLSALVESRRPVRSPSPRST